MAILITSCTDDFASTDEGISSDDGAADINEEDVVIDNDEYQDVSMNNTINAEATNSPKRVLVFTNMVLLVLLAVCKYGSVDGTFKAMTKIQRKVTFDVVKLLVFIYVVLVIFVSFPFKQFAFSQ